MNPVRFQPWCWVSSVLHRRGVDGDIRGFLRRTLEMNTASRIPPAAPSRPTLSLYRPEPGESNVSRWRINGHAARIVIWTSEEFDRLTDRPTDARFNACGVWCALRID